MIKCTFENGNEGLLRHVTVGSIVVNDKNEVLLIKRAPQLINGNLYALPGGFLDRNETTQQGALRELKEETGYEGKIVNLFQVIDSPSRPKEDRQNVDFKYIVELTGGSKKDNNEVSSIDWVSLDSLPKERDRAFDHIESIELYKKYLKKPFPLPVLNWNI
ncbi:MAG: NUDIX hydrolase [Candidatus Levybacteria bacterium]|nr:NUDIX hydrolase [Candidatus Levybacteria bacterium]